MRGVVVVVLIALAAAPVAAQTTSTSDVEHIRAALMTAPSQSLFNLPPEPQPHRVGPVTLTVPEQPGEAVAVTVPVGALMMNAVHSLAAAEHRRAERAAHEEVIRALAAFQNVVADGAPPSATAGK